MARKPSPTRSLVRLLEAAASPIYLLDSRQRIAYGNPAFSRWVGRPAEELAGVRCDYHSSAAVAGSLELAAALCPPPDAFSGLKASGTVAAVAADGKLDQRPANFVRLTGSDEQAGLLVIVDLLATQSAESKVHAVSISPERLHAQLQRLRSTLGRRYHIGQLVGESEAMGRVRQQVRLAAQSDARVLVVGPPGSGRQHVARTIHITRPAAAIGPLVPIDCPLIDAEEMQSVLTSLLRRQAEDGGRRPPVALLLEVDRLRADAQQELAEFLLLPDVELRVLSTARVPLVRLAAKRKFRRDLAYALSTLTIVLPALASRPNDIPLLAQLFLEEFNAEGRTQLGGFAPPALDELVAYEWPENVAELAQVVRAACERAAGPHVLATDLPDKIHLAAGAAAHPRADQQPIQLDEILAQIETELIRRALRGAKGNKSKAAQLLGVNRARLLRRLVQLGLAAPAVLEEPVVFEPLPDESPASGQPSG